MKRDQAYFITPIPKGKAAVMRILLLSFSFVFFFSTAVALWIFAPLIYPLLYSFIPQAEEIAQLPDVANRLIPFSTPAPETIVRPYPIQIPLDSTVNPAEASSDWIRIPAIEVNVPVAESPSLADEDVVKTLIKGAALYPNGVTPGALGNAFIAAHSSGEPWKGVYRFAFTRINELKEGDAIYIDWKGARYSYRIVESELVTPTADFFIPSDRPIPTITLMACWPIWSTKQRILIHAELTNITQLTRPATK